MIINFFHVLDVRKGLPFGFEENSVNLKDKCFSYISSVAGKETILGIWGGLELSDVQKAIMLCLCLCVYD